MSTGPEVLARLEGPLSLGDAEDLLNWMQPLCGVACRVVLDLRAVEQIDPAGVRVLVLLQEELAAASGELRIMVQPGSRVERTLVLLRLQERFKLDDALPAGVSA
jgi:anti-anti-sigma factor